MKNHLKNKRKIQCKKCKLKNFISILHSSVPPTKLQVTSSLTSKFHQSINNNEFYYTQK